MAESVAMPRASAPAAPLVVADPRRWTVLSVVLVGGSMAILDASILDVAIPSIREDLHATFGDIEPVVAAYTLVYAMLLITGGRLGDLYGRKALFRQRAFSVGLGITLAFLRGNAGSAFLFALFLQVGRGFSPIQSALTFVPSAAGFFAMSLLAPRVVPLFGRHVLSLGRRLQPAADGDRRT